LAHKQVMRTCSSSSSE